MTLIYNGNDDDNRYEAPNLFPFDQPYIINGYGGNDVLVGAFLHDNTIYGGAGNDVLEGGAGINELYGGDGNDSLNAWISNDLSNLYGGSGNDTLVGGDGGGTLDGGSGADFLQGGDGADIYVVDNLGDVISEQYMPFFDNDPNPTDLVRSSVTWTLGANLENLVLTGTASIHGTGNGLNNHITGNAGNNVLNGGPGNDMIYGRDGADSLIGGDGNDDLLGGEGADRLDGGVGTRDRAHYGDATAGLVADMLFGGTNTGFAAGDVYLGIEDLHGSNFGDTLLGDSGANLIWGGDGDDVIFGRVGPDRLYGDNGNDVLLGGTGADLLDGGVGTRDRVQYSDATSGLRADLQTPATNTGFAAGDSFVGIEDLHGSTFDDMLFGDAAANIIWGAAGNDVLNGRGGQDTLQGGTGNDTLTGGVGIDSFVFNTALGATNVDQITDFSVADDTIRLENAIFTTLATTGALAGTAFTIGAAATTAAQRIIYNSETGQLFYDSNGNVAGGQTLFATLTPGLALTAADFLVI